MVATVNPTLHFDVGEPRKVNSTELERLSFFLAETIRMLLGGAIFYGLSGWSFSGIFIFCITSDNSRGLTTILRGRIVPLGLMSHDARPVS